MALSPTPTDENLNKRIIPVISFRGDIMAVEMVSCLS